MSLTARSQFFRFALVGIAGFVVDASALYLAMQYLAAGHYSGRVISYLAAATSTWALNRHFTFRAHQDSNLFREWLKFLAANAVGGIVNYSTYAVLIASMAVVSTWPVLGVAAGSIAGLIVNFTLSRRLVFTGMNGPR